MTTIAVIDYGLGNIKSICRALKKSGAEVCLTKDRDEVLSSDGVLLPGVGAFAHGMEKLISQGIDEQLREFSETGKPMLGICLGMQMLFDRSTEFGNTEGLGLIPGQVLKLEILDEAHEKLPHVNWNEIKSEDPSKWDGTILDTIKGGEDMYFVHSYYVKPSSEEDVLSTTVYSQFEYCSTVKHKNIYGCQYHPEKSATAGLKIMKNFMEICRG
ncbi:imidazole glycerol phosphate synthase subunit HisH [uncultured Neptuniibacter sp.]|uniref:imidazole glycerol phosphate synthase subunit HisH n=1 Tax=uncultured Neptuniibacter sp. TaxID=502143 RepID=UPI002616D329|nr:imidazole glycerol phosphate synthase subunit HisH [uncultured Neptuniibacter sp.]